MLQRFLYSPRTVDIEKSLGNFDELWTEKQPDSDAGQLKAKKCKRLRITAKSGNFRKIDELLTPGAAALTLQELLVDSLAFTAAVEHNQLPAAKKLLELAPDDETRKHMIMLNAVAAFSLATINNDFNFMGSLLDLAEDDNERRHMVVSANFSLHDTTAIKEHPELVNRLLQLAKGRPDVQKNILTPTLSVATAASATVAGVAYGIPDQQQAHFLDSSYLPTPASTLSFAAAASGAGIAYGIPDQQQSHFLDRSYLLAPTWTLPVTTATVATGVACRMPHQQQGQFLTSSYFNWTLPITYSTAATAPHVFYGMQLQQQDSFLASTYLPAPTLQGLNWEAQGIMKYNTRNPKKNKRDEERVRDWQFERFF